MTLQSIAESLTHRLRPPAVVPNVSLPVIQRLITR
jgi:hypothetical protein